MEVKTSKSRTGKKNMQTEHVIMGIPITSQDYAFSAKPLLPDPASQYQLLPSPANHYYKIRRSRVDLAIAKINKLGQSVDIFAQGIREHVRLGPKLSETVKGKLSLGARILQLGGVDKVFKQKFDIRDGEKLFKASQCYLSTTAGPIAGLLFISNHRVAFCSERLIKLSSPSGKLVKIHYKVMIPLRKIWRANKSEDVKRPTQKYVQIVTEDNFDFWFMGFLNHQRTFKYLQQAIHQAR
ncbi:putative GEM-like protein 8 [Henckelia pumila]|uniref:putative GEM-like protein 8 n=1 Tax=Henckelia pumila TaxID=405737 RepID=UPI003C6E38E6